MTFQKYRPMYFHSNQRSPRKIALFRFTLTSPLRLITFRGEGGLRFGLVGDMPPAAHDQYLFLAMSQNTKKFQNF